MFEEEVKRILDEPVTTTDGGSRYIDESYKRHLVGEICQLFGKPEYDASITQLPDPFEPKADELPLSSTTGFRQIGMTGLKTDEGRLLKDKEMVRAFEEAKLSPFANAYQERCVIARAQLAKDLEWEAKTAFIKDLECQKKLNEKDKYWLRELSAIDRDASDVRDFTRRVCDLIVEREQNLKKREEVK